jgi:hypothetical protein
MAQIHLGGAPSLSRVLGHHTVARYARGQLAAIRVAEFPRRAKAGGLGDRTFLFADVATSASSLISIAAGGSAEIRETRRP